MVENYREAGYKKTTRIEESFTENFGLIQNQ